MESEKTILFDPEQWNVIPNNVKTALLKWEINKQTAINALQDAMTPEEIMNFLKVKVDNTIKRVS